MKDMLEGAKGLARNPLGIIALFVALVYGFASLLLGLSSSSLTSEERLPLVWFVVLFPVLVLAAFYRLVTTYHGKLYAPQDYRDDATFIQTLSAQQQAARLDNEAQLIQGTPETPSTPIVPLSAPGASSPSAALGDQSVVELRSRLREADRLGLLKVEVGRGLLLQTQVAFGEDKSVAFDGLYTSEKEYLVVEVKFLREPWISIQRLQEILHRALAAEALLRRRGDTRKFRLLIVFVIERDEGGLTRLSQKIDPILKGSALDVEYEAHFFDKLKQELGDAPQLQLYWTRESGHRFFTIGVTRARVNTTLGVKVERWRCSLKLLEI